MATMVRMGADLPTLRLRVEHSGNGLRLLIDLFLGEQNMGETVRIPLSELGYSDKGTRGTHMLFPEPRLPPRLLEQFFELVQHVTDGEPIWLQIDYGSDILGAFPWEEELFPQLHRPVLRIPNFARNGFRTAPVKDPILICAASPRAKGAPDVVQPVRSLLEALETDRQVHLFFARGFEYEANDLSETFSNRLDIVPITPGPDFDQTLSSVEAQRSISKASHLRNNWLRWVALEMKERRKPRVHAIHMVCTGYTSGTRGALALPESPIQDSDTSWARFVGVPEFATFTELLGCQACGFTAVGHGVWREGIRLFLNELSWARPGPLISDIDGRGAVSAYHALWTGGESGIDFTEPPPAFSVHPSAISQDKKALLVTRSVGLERKTASDFSEQLRHLQDLDGTPAEEEMPRELIRSMDNLSSARPKSLLRSARDRGTLRALEYLQELSSDGASE